MKRLYVQDRVTYKTTSREYTPEGFLRVPGRVAKSGTQQYLRRELGLDGDPNSVVTVYRPESEVFKEESLATFNVADVTFIHPEELVNADNYKSVTVGVVDGPGRKDGDFVVCDLVIKDKGAIQKIESGVAELSAGYTAEYIEESGVTQDGVPYDYVQRDIKINHVAIVPVARAGRQARIYDHKPKGKSMQKVTLDGGRVVEIEDGAVAVLVNDSIERLNKQIADRDAEISRQQATIDAQKAKMDEMEKEDDEEVIREKVKEVAATKDAAKVVAGEAFTTDSVSPVEIKREALSKARPGVTWADKDEHYVAAAFDMAIEFSKEKQKTTVDSQYRQLGQDASPGTPDVKNTKDAYSEYAEKFRASTREGK